MKVRIKRQASPVAEPYWETFIYQGPADNTVAGLLDDLNYRDDIVNEKGEAVPRISWECSCLQGMCGSCAMVINGTPTLACETFLRDLKGDVITIEPLRKFTVISDLVTDRGVIAENLKTAGAYIRHFAPSTGKEYNHQYTAAKCLKCGLCLEVCPNYIRGKQFFGAAFANDCYLIASRNRDAKAAIHKAYDTHFATGCSKALSCMEVCPMHIPTIASIAKMNRAFSAPKQKETP